MNWIVQGRWQAAQSQTDEGNPVSDRVNAPTAEELQTQYLDSVYRYVARRLANRQDAEDVTAEVFGAAFQALPRFRGQCSPRAWLFGIARRKIADALRLQQRRRETVASDLPGVPEHQDSSVCLEEEAERVEAMRHLRGIVAGLPDDQREALLLQYVDGLSVAEIAAVLARSPAAANSLLQRARAAVYRAGHDYFLASDEVAR